MPLRIVIDSGPKNQGITTKLLQRYGSRKVEISAYHPQANGVGEVGHRPLKECLFKLEAAGKGDWVTNLPLVLWAIRTTTKVSTGISPFELCYGQFPVLPIDLEHPT